MKLYNYLIESKNKPLIIVDVQPAYENYINFDIYELMDFINERKGKVLFYVNADDAGLTEDTENRCWDWWHDHGLELDKRDRRVTYFDKGYGYFRNWMDFNIDDSVIIKVIRYMHQHKLWDSRDIEDLEELLGDDYNDFMEDDPITVGWLSLKVLKEHSKGYICGGGRNECLREVALYMNAFNLKTRLVNKFIYG